MIMIMSFELNVFVMLMHNCFASWLWIVSQSSHWWSSGRGILWPGQMQSTKWRQSYACGSSRLEGYDCSSGLCTHHANMPTCPHVHVLPEKYVFPSHTTLYQFRNYTTRSVGRYCVIQWNVTGVGWMWHVWNMCAHSCVCVWGDHHIWAMCTSMYMSAVCICWYVFPV